MDEFEGDTPTTRFVLETLQTYADDFETEKELLEAYKTSITSHLPKLKQAFKNNDISNATLSSHDIKGSSSYVGTDAIRFVSGKIEHFCRDDKMVEASKCMEELELEIYETIKILDQYLKEREEEMELAIIEEDDTLGAASE